MPIATRAVAGSEADIQHSRGLLTHVTRKPAKVPRTYLNMVNINLESSFKLLGQSEHERQWSRDVVEEIGISYIISVVASSLIT